MGQTEEEGRRPAPEIRKRSLEVMHKLSADASGATLKVDVIRKGIRTEGVPRAATRRFEIPRSIWGYKESSVPLEWKVLDGETAGESNEDGHFRQGHLLEML